MSPTTREQRAVARELDELRRQGATFPTTARPLKGRVIPACPPRAKWLPVWRRKFPQR